ncbi:MAG: hypothetical protein KFF73_13945 [Cyclobacteriaceae bacterium]|nr:hypothetical protein [Cyclobacteriaceae bacterium]
MKWIYNLSKILLLGTFVMFANSCEEQWDLKDGGSLEAQVYPPTSVNFVRGETENVTVNFKPFVNPGKTILSVSVYKKLETSLGMSAEVLTEEVSGDTFTQTKEELFADVPVNGEVLDENDLGPGDAWKLRYVMKMGDGKELNVTTMTTVPFTCVSDLGGEYDGVTNWIEYYGNPGTDSYSTTLAAVGGGEYTLEDLSGGMEPIVWGNPPVEATIKDICGKITLVKADYFYAYFITEGRVEADGTIYIKWRNAYDENGETWLTPQ